MLFATHDGIFHADEVVACAICKQIVGDDFKVVRTRDKEELERASIVADVGGIYDGVTNFDHHQNNFSMKRENGVKYSSAGLVWAEYGEDFVQGCFHKSPYDYNETLPVSLTEEIARIVDEAVIQGVDAVDNYQLDLVDGKIRSMTLSDIVSNMNPNTKDKDKQLTAFMDAVNLVQRILVNKVKFTYRSFVGWDVVKSLAQQCENGYIVLEEYTPFQEILGAVDDKEKVLFVVYQGLDGSWRVQTVKNAAGGDRQSLPSEWAGLRDEEFERMTGVVGSTFCHKNLFIAGACTKEGALGLAQLALS